MKKLIVLIIALSTCFTSIYSQNIKPGGKEEITIKGFVSTTVFLQDQCFKFSNGQNAQWAITKYKSGKYIKGADIRNTRMTFVFAGSQWLKGWKTGGVLEVDLFGGFNGAGAFSGQQQMFRLRMAYIDFSKNNLHLRVGQAWAPLFGTVPSSLSHIAFPLGYGSAGFVGWRFPGIFSYYNMETAGLKIRCDAAIFTGSWNGNGSNVNYETAGNINMPQFETRLNVKGNNWDFYIVGHYDKKDLADLDTEETQILEGVATEIGANAKFSIFSLKGNAYMGKNIGHQLGAMTQIQKEAKDLNSYGAWLQLGLDITGHFGIYGFYGMENVDDKQAKELFDNPRTKHRLVSFMLMYKYGQTSAGIEYLHSDLTAGQQDDNFTGNQFSASVLYKF